MKVNVRIDGREPGHVIKSAQKHQDIENVAAAIEDVGDIIVQPVDNDDEAVGFERKTWTDYADSMMERQDRSLEDQVARLREEFGPLNCAVLIEGDIRDLSDQLVRSDVLPQSVVGSMAKLFANGVPAIPCSRCYVGGVPDSKYLMDMAVRIGRKRFEGSVLSHLSTGPVDTDHSAARRMYGCLPHVGRETAEKLEEEWPVPSALMSLGPAEMVQELTAVEGVGSKTARDITEAVTGVRVDDG